MLLNCSFLTAAANNDFIPLMNEAIVIPQSSTNPQTFTFTAQIVGDLVLEGIEIFIIEFTQENSNDIFDGSFRSTVVIQPDDDGKCVVYTGPTTVYL